MESYFHKFLQKPFGRARGGIRINLCVDMLAPPFPGLKVLECDAVFGGGHMVDLHTLAHLYIFVIFIVPTFGMALGEVTFALLGCRP